MNVYIINAKGEKEKFSFQKVYRSARRAGASARIAKSITQRIESEVYSGMKTSEIYDKVKKYLTKEEPSPALKFSLKEAIRNLGPTGFPFEKYIAEIFSQQGFRVKTNQALPGFCCPSYEIDFMAEKDKILYIGECKFRNLSGGKVHQDTALSNHARFLDIKKALELKGEKSESRSMLVTNTKFTNRAISYSKCVGVELLGWRYPKERGLEYLIESQELYPITILPSFKRYMADFFAKERMMMAKDLVGIDSKKLSKRAVISFNKLRPLIREAEVLLNR